MIPFMGGMSTTEAKVDPKAKKGVPWAHIKKRDNRAYCGEEVQESREYMFSDAGHAVRIYKNSTFLRACPDCVKECESAGVGETKFMAPMSTRHEENNK